MRHYIKGDHGYFMGSYSDGNEGSGGKGASGGKSSSNGLDKSPNNGIISGGDTLSPTGANVFAVQGFRSKQKLNNH